MPNPTTETVAPEFEVLLIETHARGEQHRILAKAVFKRMDMRWHPPETVEFGGYRYKFCGVISERKFRDDIKKEGEFKLPYYQTSVKL